MVIPKPMIVDATAMYCRCIGLMPMVVSDEEARCGKRDLRAEEYDELNAHSSDAVGDYLLIGDIFAQGGCFPVQYDIVPYRADLFLEITLSHFNTPSGLRLGGKTRLQTLF